MVVVSMQQPATKLLLLGPLKAGKSAIATFLGETGDWEAAEGYRPTKGEYRDCWPAMREGASAVVLVADPDMHSADDLLMWYSEFVQKVGLPNENVMVLLNEKGDRRTNQENIAAFRLIKDVKYLAFNLRHEGDILRENINQFVTKVRSGSNEE